MDYVWEYAIELTPDDLAVARAVGEARTAANDGFPDGAIDRNRAPIEIDIQGATAELAFSKYYGLPWDGRLWTRDEWARRRDAGDVGLFQIKSAMRAHHRMIIPTHNAHLRDAPFVFVMLHDLPVARLVGWCIGEGGMRDRFFDLRLPRPAWAVPRRALAPMQTLGERFNLGR